MINDLSTLNYILYKDMVLKKLLLCNKNCITENEALKLALYAAVEILFIH